MGRAQVADSRVRDAVDAALARVHDPCSLAAGTPLNLAQMGLVREVDIDEDTGQVAVVMVVTSPACFLSANMAASITAEVLRVEGVVAVDVQIDDDFRWTPQNITSEGRELLAVNHTRTIEALGLRPQQWRDAPTSNRVTPPVATEAGV